MASSQSRQPAVTVKVGKATITIPAEVVAAALSDPRAQRLLARITRR